MLSSSVFPLKAVKQIKTSLARGSLKIIFTFKGKTELARKQIFKL